jgi:hypothetical protein
MLAKKMLAKNVGDVVLNSEVVGLAPEVGFLLTRL